MATSGQTLNDRINAARYALAGQGLARCVCKATTEEVIGPKKKHLDYLLACTHEPNVSIPQLANLLIERTNHIYWVVVFKALVTVHHLMSYGNERFTQYLASSNYSFELSTFHDKTAGRDFNMSHYIRRYSRYINQKALSYRDLAYDFCKVKRGNEGMLRTMPIDKLLKDLPILQNQLDALLAFDCNANDLNNGVINACFMLLFRDLIGLYACHNDGIINLLNKYFTLNRKMCREAFDLYKKFLIRTDKTADFLRVAEAVGIDKDDIPDLRRAPNSLVDALEAHLENIESNKKILKSQQSTGNTSAKVAEGVAVLGSLTPPSSRRPNTPSNSSANGNNNQKDDFLISSFKDDEVRKALEEEARVLSQYGTNDAARASKSSKMKSTTNSTTGDQTTASSGDGSPKFSVMATSSGKSIDDFFGDADSFGNNNGFGDSTSPFDNLSATSDSGPSNSAKHVRPDLESIKSTIMSATTKLEKQLNNSNNIKNASVASSRTNEPKKASDELFSLLDATSMTQTPATTTMPSITSNPLAMGPTATSLLATSSPFDKHMPLTTTTTNGQSMPTALKPGNPFPDMADDLASAFQPPVFTTSGPNAVFKSGTSTANYTNLGGLEGFGDLLQPMSASNNNKVVFGGATSKSSFNTGPSLASTGLFKGDLDSTLANLAQNLTFDGISKTKK